MIFDGRSFNSVREAVRIFIYLDKRDEEVGFLLQFNHLLSRAVQNPVMGRIGPLLGWPPDFASIEGGRGGHGNIVLNLSGEEIGT